MERGSATIGEHVIAEIGECLEVSFTFFKMHLLDWEKGTRQLSLELEGGYSRFLNRLYQNGKPLVDDDRRLSVEMNLSVRVWKRIKDALVGLGKIIIRNGCLTNKRFEKERAERAATMRKQAAAAFETHDKRRQSRSLELVHSAKFPESLAETSGKLSENSCEKVNKINGSDLVDHMHLKKEEKKIEDSSPNGDSSIAAQIDLVTPKAKGKKSEPRDGYPTCFQEFWKLYPRKTGKGAACKQWLALPIPQRKRVWLSLRDHVPALTAQRDDPRGNYCPHPATWLSQKRYDDEVEQPKKQVNGFNGHGPAAPRKSYIVNGEELFV